MQVVIQGILTDPFAIMNAIGLIAFALVGAVKAIRERFDLLGVVVVGLATAFAGGATRDVLVNRVPLVLSSLGEIALGLFGVSLAVGLSAALESPDDHPVTVISDAIGLAAFATAGSIVAADTGLPGFGIVVIATINAVGGGACADILLDRPPFILLTDFYASCAVLGGGVFWTVTALGGAESVAAALCAVVTVGTRLAAVTYGWELPTAQRVGEVLTWPRNERSR
ncbi:trimeric intracellular cation channel family protein [Halalkalicoccus subterraneus]|uniref:trimeric intracellular cation channel family protein n=1 Tax=Halalkalicoccus subterraneus TaxID=2675002 RepID=UPI001FE29269|nr:trimeric intracellular cation channel family protein [Halalkalicoccus subterraneus]